ncbi:MAG TPA: dihydropteroate synthase [Usitatibacter sp.]|nr:dihydropteroate synthase [Usitatibacter sp.]
MLGIVNVTPNSFSDGGRFLDSASAIDHGLRLREEGADIVDVGGESTRPGAEAVALEEELRRVIPVVEALSREGVAVSVDTMKPEVMRAAIDAGCVVVNDVNAFRAPGAIEAVAGAEVNLVVMHMQGTPETMQREPHYDDVAAEVGGYLRERARALEAAGVDSERIALDPGFGFGKTLAHNVALFRALPVLVGMGYAVLVGVSRKRLIGDLTGRPLTERTAGSVAAALLAAQNGARLLRVHDVKETVDAIRVWAALEFSENHP